MLLAIDTSTGTASIALAEDGEVFAELTWRCEQNHSVELLPNLNSLLVQTGVELKSVRCIIVAKGPGSYNGLRVGVGTAKGLAFSLAVPLIGVSTLEVEAYPHAETGLPICPVLNAGRGEIATAMYRKRRSRWTQLVAEHIATVDSLCLQITTETVFCGEFMPVIVNQLKKQLKQKAVIPSPAARLRRAGFLAELGYQRFKVHNYDNPATLQPIYLRRPQITKPKKPIIYKEGDKDGRLAAGAP